MNANRLPKLTYFEPKSVEEIIELRQAFGNDAVVLAGGTDVIPLLKKHNISFNHVINIKRIPELKQVCSEEDKSLRIGAAVTLRDVIDDPVVSTSYPLLRNAARSVAYNHIRNMGTLVGNVCVDNKCTFFNQSKFWWQSREDCFKRGGDRCYVVTGGKKCYALSVGDTVSALIALDASLEIIGPEGTRHTPMKDFYCGDGCKPHHLDSTEMVAAVLISPANHEWRGGFMKRSVRGTVDFAIASLSARFINNGHGVEAARISLNGVSTKPVRAKQTEAFLLGKDFDDQIIGDASSLLLKEGTPLSAIGASVLVRRHAIQAMFSDLVDSIQ